MKKAWKKPSIFLKNFSSQRQSRRKPPLHVPVQQAGQIFRRDGGITAQQMRAYAQNHAGPHALRIFLLRGGLHAAGNSDAQYDTPPNGLVSSRPCRHGIISTGASCMCSAR